MARARLGENSAQGNVRLFGHLMSRLKPRPTKTTARWPGLRFFFSAAFTGRRGLRRQRRLVLDDYDAPGRRLDPLSVVVDGGVKASGADHGTGRDFDGFGSLKEGLQRHAKVGPAARENSGGMNVAVNGRVVRDAVFLGESVRAAPAEKAVLDGLALGVLADVALARVPRDPRPFPAFCGRLRRSFWFCIVTG